MLKFIAKQECSKQLCKEWGCCISWFYNILYQFCALIDCFRIDSEKDTDNNRADNTKCKICYTDEVGVVFLPCGHLVACVRCALSLTTCAVCRQEVTATVRVFLS